MSEDQRYRSKPTFILQTVASSPAGSGVGAFSQKSLRGVACPPEDSGVVAPLRVPLDNPPGDSAG